MQHLDEALAKHREEAARKQALKANETAALAAAAGGDGVTAAGGGAGGGGGAASGSDRASGLAVELGKALGGYADVAQTFKSASGPKSLEQVGKHVFFLNCS